MMNKKKIKEKAIYLGFSNRDCEARYRCPCCDNTFGSWDIFRNDKNVTGTKDYCPKCKVELDI